MPRADNLPRMTVATHSTPCTHTPMGVKGCGEVGTIGSPAAVANAVVDALAHLGVNHVDMPATANRRASSKARRCCKPPNRKERHESLRLSQAEFRPRSGCIAGKRCGKPSDCRRHVASADHEAAAGSAGSPDRFVRHRRAQGDQRGRRHHLDRGDDASRRRRAFGRSRESSPGVGEACRRHRRPGRAQPRHHRRLAGKQRSCRGLPRCGACARRHCCNEQARVFMPTSSFAACSKPHSTPAS